MACLNLPQVAGKSENSKPVEFIAELVNDSNVHFLDQVILAFAGKIFYGYKSLLRNYLRTKI